jgi:hypothetical protein
MSTSKYSVAITNTSLGQAVGNPPYDGYIDPTSVEMYMTNVLKTASAVLGTVSAGQVVLINDYPVTMTSNTISSVVSDINALTSKHHVVAANAAGKLTLINEPLWGSVGVAVSDFTAGITAELGFLAPVASVVAAPTTLVRSIAKKRGNYRWLFLMEQLNSTGTIVQIDSVVLTGTDTTFAANPTAIQFNVSLDNDQYYSYDFSGNLIFGRNAVLYNVARALMASGTYVDVVYNPTETIPTPPPYVAAGPSSMTVVVGALTASSSDALAAVTVTPLISSVY